MTNPPLAYVECDIPEGVTLVAWRAERTQQNPRRANPLRRLRRLRPRPAHG